MKNRKKTKIPFHPYILYASQINYVFSVLADHVYKLSGTPITIPYEFVDDTEVQLSEIIENLKHITNAFEVINA